MQDFLANFLVGRVFLWGNRFAKFSSKELGGLRKIVSLRGNFVPEIFAWKSLHLQFVIGFNRINYVYTITIATNRYFK